MQDSIERLSTPSPEQPSNPTVQPTWLHWSSLLFDIISHSRNYLIPALFALFSAARGNSYGVIFAGLFFFPSLIFSIFRYFTLRYSIRQGQLVVVQGLIHRSIRTVPVARIQNIDLVQNILHRLFGVAEVRIETAAGKEPEAVLRVLSLQQVEQLRNEIFQETTHSELPNESGRFEKLPGESREGTRPFGQPLELVAQQDDSRKTRDLNSLSPAQTLVEIPVGWLIRAGLASDRGMVMVGIALGLFYQFDVWENINFGALQKLIPQNFDRFWLVMAGIVALGILLVLLRVLGVGWYLLRFYDFRLKMRGDDLQISCGLLTKVSATVPRMRIQSVSVQSNVLLRWMGLVSIRIETAGSTSNVEDASKSVSRRWFLPVLQSDLQPRILNCLRPGLSFQPDLYQWVKLSPRTFNRRIRLIVGLSALIGGVGYYFLPPWGALFGLVAMILLGLNSYLHIQSTRYARTTEGLIFESGYLTRKTTFTFFDKVQTVRVHQSPLDRRWKMARLTIDTAGAGPAEHPLAIRSLDSDFAFAEHQHLKNLAAQHQPSFA